MRSGAADILFTSVEEAIKYEIPRASLDDLEDALMRESLHAHPRVTLIQAIERKLRRIRKECMQR